MNQQDPGLEAFLQKVSESSGGTIVVSSSPSLDLMAAGLSLYLGFKQAKKDFKIVCSTPTTVAFSHLVGVDKVASKLSGKSLTVSFDYQEESIDKISYHIDDNRFNLVIQPRPGAEPLSTKNVNYHYTGESGLIIVLGALNLTDIGGLYNENKEVFEKASLVSLMVGQTAGFGQPRLTFPAASSYAEGSLSVLRGANMRVDEDLASNILQGIYQATQGLAVPGLTADTFEAVAFCVRVGGRWPIESEKQVTGLQKSGNFQPMPASESAVRSPDQIEVKEEVADFPLETESSSLMGDKKWMPRFPTDSHKV